MATHAPSVGVVGAAGGAGGGAAGGAAGGAGSNKYDLAIQQHGKERTCPLCNELCQEWNGSDWVEVGEHMRRERSSGRGGNTPYPACKQTRSVRAPTATQVQLAASRQKDKRRKLERARDKNVKK